MDDPAAWSGLRIWYEAALGLVFPRGCEACGADPDDRRAEAGDGVSVRRFAGHLCARCEGSLRPVDPPFCGVCGEVFPKGAADDFRCANCAGRRFRFAFAHAAYENAGALREMIHAFKYQGHAHLRPLMGKLFLRALDDGRITAEAPLSDWVFVPVPLHPARRREREINQAAEICRRASRELGIPIIEALRRVRPTSSQARLDRAARLENLRGAFAMSRVRRRGRRVRGARVLLVDDVFTTGATTDECARVLTSEGGARMVVALTLARG